MENGKYRKLIFLSLILAILTLPVFSYAYSDETTHPALTNETVDVFNYYYPELELNEEERNFVLEGNLNM